MATRWLEALNRFEKARFSDFQVGVALAGLTAFYLCLTAAGAERRLWYDELFTYYIANAPTLSRFWQAFQVDLNPPLSYLAVRASLKIFGDSEYAARIPSILGFLIGSLCVFSFVARRLRVIYGFLAVLVFWSTPFFYYATEARPYGLIIGFFGVAMLSWQRAIEPGRGALSLGILGLAITAMMTTHFFTLFYIGPFCLAEVVRQFRNRKLDLALWAVILLPATLLLLYLPVLTHYPGDVFPPGFQASPRKVAGFFKYTLLPESPALLIAVCAATLAGLRRHSPRSNPTGSMKSFETAFAAGLLLLPLVINLALMRSHSGFFDRYAVPTVLAYGLLFAFILAASAHLSRTAAAVAGGVICVYLAVSDLAMPLITARPAMDQVSMDQIRPDLPLVTAGGLEFLEMNKYAGASTIARLHYLTDRDLALRYSQGTIFEGLGNVKKQFQLGGSVDSYQQFVAAHRHFLVFGTPDFPADWLFERLLDIHATVGYLGVFPGPCRETQLYEVTMPGA